MKKAIIIVSAIIIAIGGIFIFQYIRSDNIEVAFLNTGASDCIIITSQTHTIMIDTGEKDDSEVIISYLKSKHINVIDYLIITHFDKDHIGSAPDILKDITVKNIIQPSYFEDSNTYEEYVDALNEAKMVPQVLTNMKTITLGSMNFTLYPPEGTDSDDDNYYSIVTTLEHGNNTFLFSGDATKQRIKEIIDKIGTDYDVFKVPHHGRINGKSEDFFTKVNPKYSIITSSAEEPEDDEVMEILNRLGSKILLTRKGNYIFSSDGKKLSLNG